MKGLRGRTRLVAAAALAAVLWPLTGCEHHFFRVEGTIASEGGALGTWRSTPKGCSRDPVDGLPEDQSSTMAAFLWDDTLARDPRYQTHSPGASDFPGRLEISRTSSGFAGTLETQKPVGSTSLDATVCSTLQLTSRDGKPIIKGGKPTLEGTLTLDCRVSGSHLTGELRFSGCEY